jgi:mannose-6-phosphate isomerase-like protein (cupin superfamily)
MEWAAFDWAGLDRAHGDAGGLYHEFLRVPALSAGLYVLPAGGVDPQKPPDEDEVYYVVSGQAVINVAGTDQPVGPGSVVYVAAEVPHHFHSIDTELRVLVFFAPAETD